MEVLSQRLLGLFIAFLLVAAPLSSANTPPPCESAYASPLQIWPPNHTMTAIQINGLGDATIQIQCISQDEPLNAKGDGSTEYDGQGVGTNTAKVRAERKGGGNGRIYHIGFVASNSEGQCSRTVQVGVPSNDPKNTSKQKSSKQQAAVDDGSLYASSADPTLCQPGRLNRSPIIFSKSVDWVELGNAYVYDVNASDPDGDTLTYKLTTAPKDMTIDPRSGLITWSTTAINVGEYPIEVRVVDIEGLSDSQRFVVQVLDLNKPPVAKNLAITTNEDTATAITLEGSDINGDQLVYRVMAPPANGQLNGTAPLLNYTPNANFNGTDTFTYRVNDGTADSTIATVTIIVNPGNDAPTANDQSISTDEDKAINILLTGADLDGDTLAFSIVAPPTSGQLSGDSSQYTYTPNANFHGVDHFTFSASDGTLASNTATVSIVVNAVDDAPIAQSINVETDEDIAVPVTLIATDNDGDTLTYVITAQPQYGQLSGTAPVLRYTPNPDFNGTEAFTYRVNDGATDSNIATVALKVNPVNDAPIASDGSVTVAQNQSIVITLTATDSDGDTLAFTLASPPQQGRVAIQNNQATYTPNTSFFGTDKFTYSARDGVANSNAATVTITVVPSNNHPPAITSTPAIAGSQDTPYTYPVIAADTDGDALTYSLSESPSGMQIDPASGMIQWSHPVQGQYPVSVSVSDIYGASTAQNYELIITPSLPPMTSQGTDFWFMFGRNVFQSHCRYTKQCILYVASQVAGSATVSIPGLNYTETHDFKGNEILSIDLTSVINTANNDEGIQNQGIHLTASQPVSAYLLNFVGSSSDATIIYPTPALGTHYSVATYAQTFNSHGAWLNIVAPSDGTTITITPSIDYDDEIELRQAKTPYEITLNRGQTYQAIAAYGSWDISGTLIQSNLPIAVFAGNECSAVVTSAACDHLVEQLAPLNTIGSTYYTLPLATRKNGDTVRVYAVENDTLVKINGKLVYYLQAGEFYTTIVENTSVITSNRPIQAMQFANSSSYDQVTSDPFMLALPAAEQFLSAYVVSTPAERFVLNFINVIAPSEAADTLKIDGQPIDPSLWQPISNTSFVGAQIPVERGSHIITGDEAFGAYVYGFYLYDSYGYLGGMAFYNGQQPAAIDFIGGDTTPEIGERFCVEAQVRDDRSDVIAIAQVNFSVTNAQPELNKQFSDLTNNNGVAEFCFTRGLATTDQVAVQAGNIENTLTIEWQPVTSGTNYPPVIESRPTIYAKARSKYQYQVIAADPNNDELTYTLINGPEGSTINSESGLVTWFVPSTIEPKESYPFEIAVTDPDGNSDRQAFNVIGALPDPHIKTPTNLVGIQGSRLSFRALVEDFDQTQAPTFTWSVVENDGNLALTSNSGNLSWQSNVTSPGTITDINPYCRKPGGTLENMEVSTKWSRLTNGLDGLIGPVYDSNQDGALNALDRKVIVGINNQNFVLALDAISGKELWRRTDLSPDRDVTGTLINFDNDDSVEFVFMRSNTGQLVRIASDGAVEWTSIDPVVNDFSRLEDTGIIPADLDNDGDYELVVGPAVFDHQGALLWRFTLPTTNLSLALASTPMVVDLNLDGQKEVVYLDQVRNAQGTLLWKLPVNSDRALKTRLAYGNFDSDANREIVVSENNGSTSVLKLVDDNGALLWEVPTAAAGKVLVADLDRGGYPEIYLSISHTKYDANGNSLWSPTLANDDLGASIADIDADGYLDILRFSPALQGLNIYDGVTGLLSYSIHNPYLRDVTLIPLFVDLDNDGHGEIIASGNHTFSFESRTNTWLPAMSTYAYRHQNSGEVDDAMRLVTNAISNSVGQTAQPASTTSQGLSGRLADLAIASVFANHHEDSRYRIGVNVVNRGILPSPAGPIIALYREAPGVAENKIGEITLDVLNAGASTQVSYIDDIDPTTLGAEIFAVLENIDDLEECETGNNMASANTVAISVTDGNAFTDTAYWRLGAVDRQIAPASYASSSGTINVGQLFQYQHSATDINKTDQLRYFLYNSPAGASIDSLTGVVRWTPRADQLGNQTLSIFSADLGLNVGVRTLTMNVLPSTTPNTPPVITSQPFIAIPGNTAYRYDVRANDPDGGYVSYALTTKPQGMTINRLSGRIDWQPSLAFRGIVSVVVTVTDEGGATATQSFTIKVGNNTAPVITSVPTTTVAAKTLYQYAIVATDPENDALSYQLTTAPTGMTVSTSGLVQWSPTQANEGNHTVSIRVTDALGASTVQTFTLTVILNVGPDIISKPPNDARVGVKYEYAVQAIDANNDPLFYSLLTAPEGASVSSEGVVSWTPIVAGATTFTLQVTDRLAFINQSWPVNVSDANTTLTASIVLAKTLVDVNESVIAQVQFEHAAGAVTTQLRVNGERVPLDNNHSAPLRFASAGVQTLEATVQDSLDTVTATTTLTVRDPNDTAGPTIMLHSPTQGQTITAPTAINASVNDDSLASWSVNLRSVSSTDSQRVAEGTTTFTTTNIATLDPTLLLNGQYELELRAQDLGGNVATTAVSVVIEDDLKVGNFSFTVTDLEVPLSGLPIRVNRTYDSRRRHENLDVGYGWTLDYQNVKLEESREPSRGWSLQEISSSPFIPSTFCIEPVGGAPIITVTLPDGEVERFEAGVSPRCNAVSPLLDVAFSFTAVDNTTSTLSQNQVGTVRFNAGELLDINTLSPAAINRYTLTTREGYVYELDQTFGIRTVRDPNGNLITYNHEGITHSDGVGVTFERDSAGRITALIDPAGQRITYAFNTNGDLVASTDRTLATTTYTYNLSHGLIDMLDPLNRRVLRNIYDDNGRLIAQEDSDGNRQTFDHNIEGRQSTVTDRNGHTTVFYYDDNGNVTTQVDALGNTTTYTYDDNGNQTSETNALGQTTRATFNAAGDQLTDVDALGNTTTFTYNTRGQELTIADALGRTFNNTYDTAGNLTSIRDPNGHTAATVINSKGLVTQTTDALGHITRYAYDTKGNKLSETNALGDITTYTYDANGNVLSETQSKDNGTVTTTYQYDAHNRVIQTTDHLGRTTETEYDLVGNEIATIDAAGRRTDMSYDLYGRLTQTTYPDDSTSSKTYDNEGNVLTEIDQAGRTTRYSYDALNRVIATTLPDGSITRTSYDAAGRVVANIDARGNRTEYTYDAAGRRTATEDALGNVHRFEYDANGNLIAEIDALNRRTEYTYNALDQRIATTYVNASTTGETFDALGRRTHSTDQANVTTRYEYDALGRLTTVIDAQGNRTQYTFDEMGNQLTQTDAEGRTTTWTYDALGRQTSRTLPLGQTETFRYDTAGNLSSRTDFNGHTTTYEYDEMDRLITTTYADGRIETISYTPTGQRASVSVNGATTTYHYDVMDRLIQETQPDGSVLAYEYDANGNKTQLTVTHNGDSADTTYTYDALNRLASVTDENGITTYAYDAVGNRASLTHANGTTTVYTYDQLNRLTNVENRHGATVINSFAYSLDPTGRRTRISENTGRVTTYSYDNLYRLLGEHISDAANGNYQASYQYDRVGNRTQQIINGATTQFHYDANDRILQMGGTTYSYDANGNTLNETTNGITTHYTFDAKNKLATVQRNGVTTLFNYNADGIRTSQTTGNNTTKYIVDHNQPYAQVLIEAANDETIFYTVGDDLLSQRKNNVTSFFHYDGLGSTRALTNDAGATTDKWDFEAFGDVLNREGSTENNYLFTGEQFDKNLNQYYLRARYYNPANGRFTQQDTYQGRTGEPATLHKYLYAHANPVNGIDPSGNMTLSQGMGVSIGFAVLGAIAINSSSYSNWMTAGLADAGSGEDFDPSRLSGTAKGFLMVAAMSPAGLKMLESISQKNETDENGRPIILYHGSSVDSLVSLLNGAPLSAAVAMENKFTGEGSLLGFYLTPDYVAAEFFGLRRGGGVIQFEFTDQAFQMIRSGSIMQPIPPIGSSTRSPGMEMIVRPVMFPLFDSLRRSGQITATPTN